VTVPGVEVLHGETSASRTSVSAGCDYRDASTVTHFRPVDHPLWLSIVTFARDGEMQWSPPHGDEAIYVLAGRASIDDGTCAGAGVVIVESAAPASLRVDAGSRLIHFGTYDPTPPSDGPYGRPDAAGHGVHVVGPDGQWNTSTPERTTRFYANSTCPTCRITLLYVAQATPYRAPSHEHSQDELLIVLDGAIKVGRQTAEAGSAVAIKAGQRYGFQATSNWSFLNYRRDASYLTRSPRSAPILEDGGSRSTVPGDRAHQRLG
jgi:quercetin dioxygenase-like cupin family protein